MDNLDYRSQLIEFEREAIGGKMEGAGLYVANSDHKVDWIVVKAICDWGDGRKGTSKAARQKKAAKNAADLLSHAFQGSEQAEILVTSVTLIPHSMQAHALPREAFRAEFVLASGPCNTDGARHRAGGSG
jgi:hypothetical protein